MISPSYLKTLVTMCDLPTAPYAERHVMAWLVRWAEGKEGVTVERDPVGNVYLHYRRGAFAGPPLMIEAHMDHPGFVAEGSDEQGRLRALFRGGVRPSSFPGARARFFVEEGKGVAAGHWTEGANIIEATPVEGTRSVFKVALERPREEVPAGAIGMWDLPDAGVEGDVFAARVCDDVAGVAAGVCLLEELIERKVDGHVVLMASRAEEVGFAGVLAACVNGWVPAGARVVGLETSKGSAGAPQGAGPIIRVGDKTGIFSPGLTHFLCQAAGYVGDEDASFAYQRRLMDGGTCNSTAFTAFGYDAAGMCVALGNYHNQTVEGEAGWGHGGRAGPAIGSESIHLNDFAGMVRVLVEATRRYATYQPGFGTIRDRYAKMHEEEQRQVLWETRAG